MSGHDTFLIVTGALGVVVLVLRLKYAPPWWLRRHRENTSQHHQDVKARQPHDHREDGRRDADGSGNG